MLKRSKFATIDYTNWRGERGVRDIRPVRIEWGSNEWHPEPQWLLVAHDAGTNTERTFAMEKIHTFTPCVE